jgi:hypothetical protein
MDVLVYFIGRQENYAIYKQLEKSSKTINKARN